MKSRKIAELGLLSALAIIFGWVEHMVPLLPSIPGIKLGLGNIVVVLALYRFGKREAFAVSLVKVLLSALLFGSVSGLAYSASGAALSFAVMCLIYKNEKFTPVGVSAAGGAAHICAQVAAAMILTSTVQLWRLVPPLLVSGVVTGALSGVVALMIQKKLKGVTY